MTAHPALVDTHAHLADSRLSSRLGEVLTNARSSGVGRIIAVGTTAADSDTVVAMAQDHPEQVLAAVGIHPSARAAERHLARSVDYDSGSRAAVSAEATKRP